MPYGVHLLCVTTSWLCQLCEWKCCCSLMQPNIHLFYYITAESKANNTDIEVQTTTYLHFNYCTLQFLVIFSFYHYSLWRFIYVPLHICIFFFSLGVYLDLCRCHTRWGGTTYTEGLHSRGEDYTVQVLHGSLPLPFHCGDTQNKYPKGAINSHWKPSQQGVVSHRAMFVPQGGGGEAGMQNVAVPITGLHWRVSHQGRSSFS